MKTEKALQLYIKKLCNKHKIGYYKMHCEGKTGFPDLMLTYNGHIIFIEVKSPAGTGRISARQHLIIDTLRKQGQEVHIVAEKITAIYAITQIINRPPTASYRQTL